MPRGHAWSSLVWQLSSLLLAFPWPVRHLQLPQESLDHALLDSLREQLARYGPEHFALASPACPGPAPEAVTGYPWALVISAFLLGFATGSSRPFCMAAQVFGGA